MILMFSKTRVITDAIANIIVFGTRFMQTDRSLILDKRFLWPLPVMAQAVL